MAELNSLSALLADPNLKAYYRGENFNDTTANAFNLTNSTGTSNVPAKFSNGISGDGVDDNVFITNNLGIDGGAISMSLWVKPNSEIASGQWGLICQTSATSKVRYEIFYEYNGGTRQVRFNRVKNNVGTEGGTSSITMGTSAFTHLVLTYNGTTLKGYVNNVEVLNTSASGSGATTGNSSLILLARDNGDNTINQQDYSNVILDDVAIFNDALTTDEIDDLYTDPTAPTTGAAFFLNFV